MVDERSFLFGYFFARRNAKPWKAGPRKRPKMPSTPWRVWAVICIAVGATLSWAVSQDADTATIVVRTVLGGVFGMAIGMYVVETVWEKRFHGRHDPPTSPIGRRR
jgi:hypothetical protein